MSKPAPKNQLPVENLYLERYTVQYDRSSQNDEGDTLVTITVVLNNKEFTHEKYMWRMEVSEYLESFDGEL